MREVLQSERLYEGAVVLSGRVVASDHEQCPHISCTCPTPDRHPAAALPVASPVVVVVVAGTGTDCIKSSLVVIISVTCTMASACGSVANGHHAQWLDIHGCCCPLSGARRGTAPASWCSVYIHAVEAT